MPGRKALALIVMGPMLLAACSASASPTGLAATNPPSRTAPAVTKAPATAAPTPAATLAPTDVPSATETEADQSPSAEATPAPPPKPTKFVATFVDGSVPCPSPDAETGDNCQQVNLSWQSTADGATFRIYAAWTGEGDATCDDATIQQQMQPVLDTEPDATSAKLYNALATGGGAECLWITAVTDAGESAPVAAQGQ